MLRAWSGYTRAVCTQMRYVVPETYLNWFSRPYKRLWTTTASECQYFWRSDPHIRKSPAVQLARRRKTSHEFSTRGRRPVAIAPGMGCGPQRGTGWHICSSPLQFVLYKLLSLSYSAGFSVDFVVITRNEKLWPNIQDIEFGVPDFCQTSGSVPARTPNSKHNCRTEVTLIAAI